MDRKLQKLLFVVACFCVLKNALDAYPYFYGIYAISSLTKKVDDLNKSTTEGLSMARAKSPDSYVIFNEIEEYVVKLNYLTKELEKMGE